MAAQGGVGGRMGAMLALTAVLAMLAGEDAAGADAAASKRPKPQGEALRPDPLVGDGFRLDAALWDVCFVDSQRGWAVGDRGTIWHTEDGGRQWVLQPSGVSCRLESVWFVSAELGWAAGWVSHPYLHTGAGVLLWTQDGGKHWSRDAKLILPALKRIRMSNARSGWAVGCPSAMYPSGVLVTDSGGRGWNPLVSARSPGWLAADDLGPQWLALAGRGGARGLVRRGDLRLADPLDVGLREAGGLRLTAPNGGWLVGQGGLILRTADGGLTWHAPPGDLAELVSWPLDFSALAVRGPKCWIAGSPGSRVFVTADAGNSWSAFPTGQTLPLTAMTFADDQNGWAVGQLGTILATNDGGRTWRRQRA